MNTPNNHWFTGLLLACSLLLMKPASATLPADPLDSPAWPVMKKQFLGEGEVVFDPRVIVMAPEDAEDSLNVPVRFNLEQIPNIKQVTVIADLNPLPLTLRFYPYSVKPNLSFSIKLQQATPIRVAAQTQDGVWHVGGRWVNAAGGGCTEPSIGTSSGDWSDTLGNVSTKVWPRTNGVNRIKLQIMHPMDTGLASGIPRFHLQELFLKDQQGQTLARVETYEPISENPLLSFEVEGKQGFHIQGTDNNGNQIIAEVK